ncbi:MAG: hypothetical protein LBS50_02345 [Prevotellaceae bacterium]|jgi:hypothetical protein|nr:hypothetical protein [Prevotellaceae bacterium]
MKKSLLFLLFAAIFFACKKPNIKPENTYIGTWNVAVIYLNNGSANMKGLAETFSPCLKGATLEFTEDLRFDLQCDCDWMRAAGTYLFDNKSITATDTLQAEQLTQVFIFADGFLSKVVQVEAGTMSYKFDLRFKKIE